MKVQIIENYTPCGVNVGKIVKRILKYAPPSSIEDLKQILIFDVNPQGRGFACYRGRERTIEIYVKDIIGWLPWILKKTYIFPYFAIAGAIGHELDHHVHRDNKNHDSELSAESNALTYVYPSFGLFKPVIKFIRVLTNKNKH